MSERVELEIDLDQNVDREAKQAARGLDKFDRSADKAGRGAGKAGRQFTKTESGLDSLKSTVSSMKAPIMGLVAAFTAVGVAAGAVTAKFGEAVLKGNDFARTTRGMFSSFTGSAAEGEAALEDIMRIARKTAAPLEEVRKSYGTLRATGVEGQLLNDLVTMRFDFLAMGEEAESAFGKFTDAMVEGEVTASQFEDIAKNLGGKDVFGKALGLSELAMQDTQAGAEQLGKELKEMDPKHMLEVAAATHDARSGLGKTAKAAAALEARLRSLSELGGLEIGRRVDSPFAGILDDAEKFAASKDGQKLFSDIADAINTALPIVMAFGTGLMVSFSVLGAVLDPVIAGIAKLMGTTDAGVWEGLFAGVGLVVGVLGGFAALLISIPLQLLAFGVIVGTAAFSWARDLVSGVSSGVSGVQFQLQFMKLNMQIHFDALKAQAIGWGANLVSGFAEGITSGAAQAVAAVKSVVSQVKSAATSGLDLHSPSKVFEDIGANVTAGAAGGIQSGIPDLKAATASTFDPSVMTADAPAIAAPGPELFGAMGGGSAPAAAPAASGGGGGGGGNTVNITVNCEAGDDGDSIAQKVRREVETALMGLALQGGV